MKLWWAAKDVEEIKSFMKDFFDGTANNGNPWKSNFNTSYKPLGKLKELIDVGVIPMNFSEPLYLKQGEEEFRERAFITALVDKRTSNIKKIFEEIATNKDITITTFNPKFKTFKIYNSPPDNVTISILANKVIPTSWVNKVANTSITADDVDTHVGIGYFLNAYSSHTYLSFLEHKRYKKEASDNYYFVQFVNIQTPSAENPTAGAGIEDIILNAFRKFNNVAVPQVEVRDIPPGANGEAPVDSVGMEIKEGDSMVDFNNESSFGRIYLESSFNRLDKNPFNREPIDRSSIKKYKAHINSALPPQGGRRVRRKTYRKRRMNAV